MSSGEHVPLDDESACTACGRFGAHRFEDEALCPDCYAARGACCAEPPGADAGAAGCGRSATRGSPRTD